MGGANNEFLSNLVNHVAQLTKQQGTLNVVRFRPTHESYANSVEDSIVV